MLIPPYPCKNLLTVFSYFTRCNFKGKKATLKGCTTTINVTIHGFYRSLSTSFPSRFPLGIMDTAVLTFTVSFLTPADKLALRVGAGPVSGSLALTDKSSFTTFYL